MLDEMSGVEKQPKKKYEKPRLDKEPSQAERLTSLQKPPEPIPVPDMREAGTVLAVGAGIVGAAAGKLFGKGKEERAEAKSVSTPEPGVKEELPALETKEREIETVGEAMEYLKDNWRMADSLPDDEKRQFATSLKIKLESARWASRTQFFEGAKSKVADLMRKLVEDDNFWASVQASGMPRSEQISALASRLDALRNDIPDAEGNREGLRDAWLENIARDWRLAYLRAKDSAGHPGNRTDQIREMEGERRYLGWGSVKTPGTQILIQELAERAASWDEQNDPGLKKWSDAKADAEAAVGAKAGGITSLKDLFPAVEYREKDGFATLFVEDGDFVRKYGFPKWLKYSGAGLEAIRRKTVNILTDAIVNAAIKPFESIEFINAAGEEFVFAFRSLFAARDRTKAGSWKELTGDADYGIPSALEGMNIKFSLEYLSKNEGFRRVVDILMAADGRLWEGEGDTKYSFITDPVDRLLVKYLIELEYQKWISIPGSKGVHEKDLSENLKHTLSQGEARERMDSFSRVATDRLKAEGVNIDVGTVYLARELVALMGYGVEFEAMRTMQAKMAKDGSAYSLVAGSGDTCLMPFLKKTGIKGDYGLLHDAYREGGFAKMAEVAKGLKGAELFQWARGMRSLTDNLDEIEKMLDPDKKGAALSSKNKEEYLSKVGEFLKKLTEGDPPLMKPETAKKILEAAQEKWGVMEKGGLAKAAEVSLGEKYERIMRLQGPRYSSLDFWEGLTGLPLGKIFRRFLKIRQ